jgi:hypothetical protein
MLYFGDRKFFGIEDIKRWLLISTPGLNSRILGNTLEKLSKTEKS